MSSIVPGLYAQLFDGHGHAAVLVRPVERTEEAFRIARGAQQMRCLQQTRKLIRRQHRHVGMSGALNDHCFPGRGDFIQQGREVRAGVVVSDGARAGMLV